MMQNQHLAVYYSLYSVHAFYELEYNLMYIEHNKRNIILKCTDVNYRTCTMQGKEIYFDVPYFYFCCAV